MKRRPRLLDLFCGAGGAAVGYHRAGFEVVGVDLVHQPNYPFEFWQLDALDVLDWLLTGRWQRYPRSEIAAVHASPPCQGYSRMRHLPWLRDRDYPMLIDPVRAALHELGLPFVIENVEDAPLDPSIVLCGRMFGLPLYRHRRFELSHWMLAPGHPRHEEVIFKGRLLNSRYSSNGSGVIGVVGNTSGVRIEHARRAMGIDWMARDELTQAIPPAYTEFVGQQLLQALETAA